jgi:hypothetical protein
MKYEEFKAKWLPYIEKGFEEYGIEISDPQVLEWLDSEFEKELQLNPKFEFAQIKLKFGMARVYSNSKKDRYWEEGIDIILES